MICRYFLYTLSLILPICIVGTAHAEDKKVEKTEKAAAKEDAPTTANEAAATFYEFPFVCEADIHYTWKPLPPPPPKEEAVKPADPKAPPADEKTAEKEIEPITVFYKRAGAEGREEADVRRKLTATLQNAKKAALEYCNDKHQNQAACISKGFAIIRNEYREADFHLRKPLLDSVTKSCEANYGICTAANHGEITCYENRPPDLRPKAAEVEAPAKK